VEALVEVLFLALEEQVVAVLGVRLILEELLVLSI
jgi:hypothetical protein